MANYLDWHPTDLFSLVDDPLKEIHCILNVDGLYYKSALINFAIATGLKDEINTAKINLKNNEDFSLLEGYDLGDDIDICSGRDVPGFVEALEYLENIYSNYLQNLFSVHIFCALCLEAHINNLARELLNGKVRDEFDNLSIRAKWLMLPLLVHKDLFDVGAEPFQTFSRIVKIRNNLVHFKASQEKWRKSYTAHGRSIWGLSLEDAKQSLKGTKDIICELAEKLSIEPPEWLKNKGNKFFRIEIDNINI